MTKNDTIAENIDRFIAIVRQRSAENEIALKKMVDAAILSQAVSIIRQEIDSLIRLRYILNLAPSDRYKVIRNFLHGSFRGPNGRTKIKDSDMVDFASRLEGWPRVAYDFACSFVHLSNLHAYREKDPLGALNITERDRILAYLRRYHGRPVEDQPDTQAYGSCGTRI